MTMNNVAELHFLDSGTIQQIYNGTNIVGSAPKVDVHVEGVGVSSYHAIIEISPDGSEHFIEDLSSTNGTFLGTAEYRLCSRRLYQLLDNKIITFGPTKCQYKILQDKWSELTENSSESTLPLTKNTPTEINRDSVSEESNNNVIERSTSAIVVDHGQTVELKPADSKLQSGESEINNLNTNTQGTSQVDELVSGEEAVVQKENKTVDTMYGDNPSLKQSKGRKGTVQRNRRSRSKSEHLEDSPIDEILSNDTPVKTASTRKKRPSLTLKNAEPENRLSKKQRNSLDNKEVPKVLLGKIITLEECRETLDYLKGEEVLDYKNCTHFVMDIMRRTVKFLCCLSYGKYIVTSKWLEASMKADESKYILKDAKDERKWGFNLKNSISLARSNLEHPIFKNIVFFSTKSVKPEYEELKQILEAAGGKA
ncbi:Mediator of DNA damage checkpoint protein 1 [Boothiomyces sp. JEL0838]|nr:Mediator of DNA damage checkpoint protein 1 [Boothiomyces sp. JEL0838]